MLLFNSRYANDEKAEELMEKFINDRVLDWFNVNVQIVKKDGGYYFSPFYEEDTKSWMPRVDWFDLGYQANTLIGVHEKLISEQKEELNCLEKYVVHRILCEIAEYDKEVEEEGYPIPLPKPLYLYQVIKDEGIDEECDWTPEEVLQDWANLRFTVDFLFPDTDYLLMDIFPKRFFIKE